MGIDRAIVLGFMALLVATPAAAEIYQHVDSEGRVVYTNRAETVPADQRSAWKPTANRVQRFQRESSAPERDVERQSLLAGRDRSA